MSAYRRILAAIDLTEESLAVSARACQLARPAGAVVTLLHVVEFVPIEPMSDSLVPVVQVDDQLLSRARRQLQELAVQLGLPPEAGNVETGSAKAEILIVIGCRERHGLSLLIHRTEDSVLHGAPCDVLAVRVREPGAAQARASAAANPGRSAPRR